MGNHVLVGVACVVGGFFGTMACFALGRTSTTTDNQAAPATTARATSVKPSGSPHVPLDGAGAASFLPGARGQLDDVELRVRNAGVEAAAASEPSASTLAAANLHLAGPDYQPTRERFLDMGRTMAALEPEELWEVDETFWERWPQYEFLRHSWRSGTLSEALGVVVDPVAELERLWPQRGVQALWVEHCAAAWERANLDHAPEGKWKAEREDAIERRLYALRSDLWARAGETYLWLWEVGRER